MNKLLVLFLLFFIPSYAIPPLESLSLEEKVGQLLIVHFYGTEANEEAKFLIQNTGIGGFIYYNWSNELSSPIQVKNLSVELQNLSFKKNAIPLFIAVDQEGGIVARLSEGFTQFPGNRALGEANDLDLAEQAAWVIGSELKAVGINLNLSPVVDVNINPQNPIIGIRSFGENPEKVSAFGARTVKGYQRAGIITTLKHFPGHGDSTVDSHEDLPIIHKSIEELTKVELLPFIKLASHADIIMTAHLLVPSLDAENCSTLSKKTLGFLKNHIGFQGIIMADSLVMEGLLKQCHSLDEAAILALNAGCDILLLGGKQLNARESLELNVHDIARIKNSIVDAIKNGRISEKRLNQAVKKVLELKERSLDFSTLDSRLVSQINTPAHREIAEKIAFLALKVSYNPAHKNPLLHDPKKISFFAPACLENSLQQTSFSIKDFCFFESLNPAEIDSVNQRVDSADILIIFSTNAWKNPAQKALINSLLNRKKPAILVVTRDPLDNSLFPSVDLIFNTFSPTPPSLQAVYNYLFKTEKRLSISLEEARKMGEKIWKNECRGSLKGLTHWNNGEHFPSLGIGHFIWYPEQNHDPFQETFPSLINFLREQGVIIPEWLTAETPCPWNTKEEFYKNSEDPKMLSLKELLSSTLDLQALFMVQRLKEAFPLITEKCTSEEREKISSICSSLAKDTKGLYALLDYLNFKGSGLSPQESYNGQGWGLLQILKELSNHASPTLVDFVNAAKKILKQRVENAPPGRNEKQWLKGWYNRLDTYLSP